MAVTALNGRLAPGALAPIAGHPGARLRPDAAGSWARIRSETARQHGWTPAITSNADAYRSYETQLRIFIDRYTTAYLAGRPTKTWNGRTYWLKHGNATAAVPGTSNHGWGLAVDVTGLGGFGGTRYAQLAAVAIWHGWTNTEGRSIGEAWHWVYSPGRDTWLVSNDRGSTGGVTIPIPGGTLPDPLTPLIPHEEPDMRDYLIALYLKTLGRLPDVAGYATHLSDIATGRKTWAQLERDLEATEESAAFAALGSEDARNAKRAGSGFVI